MTAAIPAATAAINTARALATTSPNFAGQAAAVAGSSLPKATPPLNLASDASRGIVPIARA